MVVDHVKLALIKQGHDVVKKRMWEDGHMIDEKQQYIRTRSKTSPQPHIYVWDNHWNVRNSAEDLNDAGEVTFAVERDVFNLSSS